MSGAPLPEDEAERLQSLRDLKILDTATDERFERITRIVCSVIDVPVAAVSLVDKNRQWFKSIQGLPVTETPRDAAFCGYTILSDQPLIVPDATCDSRFYDNPLVTGNPHIRFYAGFPVKASQGQRIGTLCAIDMKPRQLNDKQIALLSDLRFVVESELNLENTIRLALEAREAEIHAREGAAAKSEFLANMSHEIRTPMNGMLGIAQLLQDEPLSPRQAEMVNHLKEAGKTLSRIIDDVLDLAKIESRQLAVNSQPFELEKSLRNVRSLLENGALAKGLTLRINYSPDIGAGWFVGDPLRLEQILLNLVGNAIKFTEKGEVCLSVRETSILSTTACLRFDVQDSGIGVDLAQTSWLFEPFGQADPTISRKFGGTGLGLSISKKLVEAMGGKMGVESTLGVGSTFWFELPFGLPIEKLAKRSDMANLVVRKGPRLKGLRCLVVDDTRLNRMIIEQMLSREGATSEQAVNGEEALQRLRERPSGYDAVLMDVQMPVMDGLAAARAIHGELGLTSLPIVALTAGVMSDQRQQALEAGCQDFLPKPVDLEDLVLTLLPLRKSPV